MPLRSSDAFNYYCPLFDLPLLHTLYLIPFRFQSHPLSGRWERLKQKVASRPSLEVIEISNAKFIFPSVTKFDRPYLKCRKNISSPAQRYSLILQKLDSGLGSR